MSAGRFIPTVYYVWPDIGLRSRIWSWKWKGVSTKEEAIRIAKRKAWWEDKLWSWFRLTAPQGHGIYWGVLDAEEDELWMY